MIISIRKVTRSFGKRRFILLVILLTSVVNLTKYSGNNRRQLSEERKEIGSVHTYVHDHNKVDIKLLQAWKKYWAENGWKTVVLTPNYAKRSENYKTMNDFLKKAGLNGFLYECYMGRFAMSTVSTGGFYSDLFVVPLRKPDSQLVKIVNDGRITLHDIFGFSLMSGSHQEWNLYNNALLDIFTNTHDSINYSDLFSFNIRKMIPDDIFNYKADVTEPHSIFPHEQFDTHDICDLFDGIMALRFHLSDIEDHGYSQASRPELIHSVMNLYNARCVSNRPVIFTWHGEDSSALELWKKSWFMYGWEPVVLTIQDAQRHFRYHEFLETLNSGVMFQDGANAPYFGRYMRWLAVAASGGGFMSDMDTFPLYSMLSEDNELPNGGNFTSFDISSPHLVSGTAVEWNRIIDMLLTSFQSHSEIEWTDEIAFSDLNSLQSYIQNDDIISPGNLTESPNPFDDNVCEMNSGKVAIRFPSHEDMADMEKWILDWRKSCNTEHSSTEKQLDWFDESEKVISTSINTASFHNCLVNIHGLHHSDNEFARTAIHGAIGEKASVHNVDKKDAEGQYLQTIYPTFIYRQNHYEVCGLHEHSPKSVGMLYYCPNIIQQTVNPINKMILFNEWSRFWDLNKPYLIQQTSTFDILLLEKLKLVPTFHVIIMTHPFRWEHKDNHHMDKLSLLFVWLDVWTHTFEALQQIQSFAVINYEMLLSSSSNNTSYDLHTSIENSCFPDTPSEQLQPYQQNVLDAKQGDTEVFLWEFCAQDNECRSLMDDLTPIISQFGYSWNSTNPFSPSYVESSTSNLLFSPNNLPTTQLLQEMKALVNEYIS